MKQKIQQLIIAATIILAAGNNCAVAQSNSTAISSTKAENEKLKRKIKMLSESLEEATHESVLKKLEDAKLQREYEEALAVLERIPPEVLEEYAKPKATHRTAELLIKKEKCHEECL